ncbi:LytR/AlgR family response regulator transcription factor [Spongiivirga citrea]|uniref:Response regulator n=1 Tax=Spongiivirga citrea TaxID=1481457 RepID=A0A6M0CKA7_9FLAO|nr:LytTR family DNA-binding domain-containing protein [Spongiivirga citrea]NER15877.1 response regulator [Spongiivirga citrea]
MKKSMSCIIIEDDVSAASMAQEIITTNFNEISIASIIPDIQSAYIQLKQEQPDFVILDVNLKDGNAFDLLKQLDAINFKIIFTTSFDKYAVQAFKFSALDYLLKPYIPSDLVTAVEKVIADLDRTTQTNQLDAFYHNVNTSNIDKKLVLKNLDAIYVVLVNDVIYVESDNNYSKFYLNDERKILVSKTLKTFEEQLKESRFLRVHQRFLINLDHIQAYHKKTDMLLLSGNREIPVSQSKKAILTRFLDQLS